jgi:chromate transport protein ChrA
LKESIENNRMVQHLILLILIMTLMIIFGNPLGIEITHNEQTNSIIMSLLIYVWFILTTKLDLTWNVSILIILTIYFIYESKKISDYKIILKDDNLDINKKKELLDSFNQFQKYLIFTIFGITLSGTFLYANEKQVQYGGGFNIYNFFFY